MEKATRTKPVWKDRFRSAMAMAVLPAPYSEVWAVAAFLRDGRFCLFSVSVPWASGCASGRKRHTTRAARQTC